MNRPTNEPVASGRVAVRVFVLVCVAVVAGNVGTDLPILQDFIEYWTAGRLNLRAGNPYDPEAMLRMQQVLRPEQASVIMMWNPPWALALVMPFAALDFEVARWAWLSVHIAVMLGCTQWLWHYFGGKEPGAWAASAVCLLFPPTFYALGMGQISPFLLLGLCGFLYCERRGWWIAAGAFAALTLLKPHWLYLFWIALLVWGVHRRQWTLLLGSALAVLGTLGVAVWVNPQVIGHYLTAVQDYPPDYFVAPTAGVLLRAVLGWERDWPQFLPSLLGAAWFWWYWRRREGTWQWSRSLPAILIVSTLTAAYGWSFDQLVLLIPMLWIAARLVRSRSPVVAAGLACYVAGGILLVRLWPFPLFVVSAETREGLVSMMISEPNMFWHITVLPFFAVGFAVAAWSRDSDWSRDPERSPASVA